MKNIKFVISLVICLFITLFLIGCNNKQDNTKKIEETQTTLTEEVTEQQEEAESEYIELNEDGVAPLDGDYSKNCQAYDSAYDQVVGNYIETPDTSETDKWFHIFTKSANESIKKLRRSDVAAIYTTDDEIDFYKVTNPPQYTVPLDFEDPMGDLSSVNGYPKNFGTFFEYFSAVGDEQPYPFEESGLTDPECPIVEVNGEELEEYVNGNCYNFRNVIGYWTNDNEGHKILVCKKNEEVTLGGYVGTKWVESKVYASTEYYKVEAGNCTTIKSEKTKNGYFTVDISSLETGIYFVKPYYNFIEIV